MKTIPEKDQELAEEQNQVENAKRDPALFRPLYEKYYKEIFRFVFHRTNDREMATDLTSQVFVKALSHLPNLIAKHILT